LSDSISSQESQAGPTIIALGLMSGTSLDGIDAALLRTDGTTVSELGPAHTVAYTDDERKLLRRAVDVALGCDRRPESDPPEIVAATALVTDAHARLIEGLMAKLKASEWQPDVVGFHGQTILHRPDDGWTWQIGDGDALAARLGVTVVDDFRSADMAAGGQGAPFAPLYHQALVRSLKPAAAEPIVVLNVGGVANVTWVGPDGQLLAFDTGPGNGLLDDWMALRGGQPSDWGGEFAARGRVNDAALATMMANKFFEILPPKSLDRHDFNLDAVRSLSVEDGAATLTRYTARTVAAARAFFPGPPRRWIVCGGGRHNPVMMAEIAKAVEAPVSAAEDVNWRGDTIEAEAFGLLAVAALRKLPLSFPTTTGVAHPVTGGLIHSIAK